MLSKNKLMKLIPILILVLTSSLIASTSVIAFELNSNCSVNILNRTIQVSEDGTWEMPNVPSFMGRIRARVTCINDGDTISGATPFFTVLTNEEILVDDFIFLSESTTQNIDSRELTFLVEGELYLTDTLPQSAKIYKKGEGFLFEDLTEEEKSGLNLISSNQNILRIENQQLIAVSSGTAVVTARIDGSIAIQTVSIRLGDQADSDSDGLPDDYETANGLDPNDPIDAFEDQDGDGLSALEEFNAGTDLNVVDTDGDGLSDGEELIAGEDGFITNPLLEDTDGDGLNDGLENLIGSDPTDEDDGDFADVLDSLIVEPSQLDLVFNGVDTEASQQLTVFGVLIDGSRVDLTAISTGTNYATSDVSIASFGLTDGEVFAGQTGSAIITVTNSGYSETINVHVERFLPSLVSLFAVEEAVDIDVSGTVAYVAAGERGLRIVDVSDVTNPVEVAFLDIEGFVNSVEILGNTAFLAAGQQGLVIVDITNPSLPIIISEIIANGDAIDVAVDNEFAYLVNGDDGVEVVDIVNLREPFSSSIYYTFLPVEDIAVNDSRELFASGAEVLNVFSVSDLGKLVLTDVKQVLGIEDLVADNDYVYASLDGRDLNIGSDTSVSSSGAHIYEISDSTEISLVFRNDNLRPLIAFNGDGIAKFGETLFFADPTSGAALLNIQDPANAQLQTQLGVTAGGISPSRLSVDGRYVYFIGPDQMAISNYRLVIDNLDSAPDVFLTSPSFSDELVGGQRVILEANATDEVGVSHVEFRVNDALVYTATTQPYRFPFTVPFGITSVDITATAVDFGGNQSSSEILTASVLLDTDQDGLSDQSEHNTYFTDSTLVDSDNDGINDGREVRMGLRPDLEDTDGDGLLDGDELVSGTDPLNPDVTLPFIISTQPIAEVVDVVQEDSVSILFSEVINTRLVGADTLKLIESNTNLRVSGIVSVVDSDQRLSFEPSELLKPFTNYTVEVLSVKDIAGNSSDVLTFTFTTGATVDSVGPRVTTFSPINNAEDIPINSVVRVLFDEKVDVSSLSEDNFYLYDTVTASKISTTIEVADDFKNISLVSDTTLPVGRRLSLYIRNVKDLFGNLGTSYTRNFTTSFVADVIVPDLIEMSIGDGWNEVPRNAVLALRFSEPISGLSLDGINLLKGTEVVPLNARTLSQDNQEVTLVPSQLLEVNTNYTLRVESVKDTIGNTQLGPVERSFTTSSVGDESGLSILNYSPPKFSIDVPLNAQIRIEFDQRLNLLSKYGRILLEDRTNFYNRDTLDVTISIENDNTLVIVPDQLFGPNREIIVSPTSTPRIESIAGATIGFALPFTTGSEEDLMPVELNNWSFEDGDVGIATDASWFLRFSETLDTLQCPIESSVSFSDGINEVEFSWDFDTGTNLLQITPIEELFANTIYTLSVDGLCDYVGNSITADSRTFTTGAGVDIINPNIVTFSPEDDAVGVDITAPVIFEFDESVRLQNIDDDIQDSFYVYQGSNNKLSGEISWNEDNTQLVFTPSEPFSANSEYYVTMNYRDFRDYSGNSFNYLAPLHGSITFTTEGGSANTQGPEVVQMSPQDGSVDLDTLTDISLTFSESIDYATINDDNFALYVNGERQGVSLSRSYDNRTVTFDPNAALPDSSLVSVVVTNGAKDYNGNSISDFVGLFTTGSGDDTDRPSVAMMYPGNGVNEVELEKEIVLYLSEQIDPNTIDNQSLKVSQNGVLVSGSRLVSSGNEVIRFIPDEPWGLDSIIQVFVENDVKDLAGNELNTYQATFRTLSDNSFGVLSTSITRNLPVTAKLQLLFSQPINPLTIDSVNVTAYDNNSGSNAFTILTLSHDNHVLNVSPSSSWAEGTSYIQVRLNNIEDTDGNVLTNKTYNFYAGNLLDDVIPPQLVQLTPHDGAENIGVNAQVRIDFNEPVNPLEISVDYFKNLERSISIDSDNLGFTIIPHKPYTSNTTITEMISSIEDASGNDAETQSTTFTTRDDLDLEPPILESVSPLNGEEISVNSVFTVRFNESVQQYIAGSNMDSYFLYDQVTREYLSHSLTWNEENTEVVLIPDVPLIAGRDYTFTVNDVYDYAGNLSGVIVRNEISIDPTGLEDIDPPEVVEISIADGWVDVPTNAKLEIRYNEPVSTVHLTGLNLFDGDEVVSLSARTLSDANKEVTLVPSELLKPNTTYFIIAESARDSSGNIQLGRVERTFSTGERVDLEPLSAAAFIPHSDATNVALNTKIRVKVNKRLNLMSAFNNGLVLYDSTAGSQVALNATIKIENDDVLVIDPEELLGANRRIQILDGYKSPSIESIAGNDANGFGSYFTTGTQEDFVAVELIGWSFEDGAMDVALTETFFIGFSEELDTLQCPVESMVTLSNGVNDVLFDWSFNTSTKSLQIAPTDNLLANSSYTLFVSALCDYAGNNLVPASMSRTFTTEQ